MTLLPKYFSRNTVFEHSFAAIGDSVQLMVVIPSFKEERIMSTLHALDRCMAPRGSVEVIVVNNLPLGSDQELLDMQKEVNRQIRAFVPSNSFLKIFVLEAFDLPKDKLGAGLARKIGMDIASLRFFEAQRSDGVIVSLDADCLVAENYFIEIQSYFRDKKRNGASIYFEHPLQGDLPDLNYRAIANYELHLRYYNLMLKYAGFPGAFQTVGSSFAVRAEAYVKAGGMTKKIAGEDFYFIQKLLCMGGYGDILTTAVYPSARLSSRVLFGTGAAVTKFVNDNACHYYTFSLEPFGHLKELFEQLDHFYLLPTGQWESIFSSLDDSIALYFVYANITTELEKLKINSPSLETFRKRFFSVFDGLVVVRYLNFVHDKLYAKISALDAAVGYLRLCQANYIPQQVDALVVEFRRIERNGGVR